MAWSTREWLLLIVPIISFILTIPATIHLFIYFKQKNETERKENRSRSYSASSGLLFQATKLCCQQETTYKNPWLKDPMQLLAIISCVLFVIFNGLGIVSSSLTAAKDYEYEDSYLLKLCNIRWFLTTLFSIPSLSPLSPH